jgi:HEAT repeat protein
VQVIIKMDNEKVSGVRMKPGKEPAEGNNGDVGNDDANGEYEREFLYYLDMLGSGDVGRRWKAAESLARIGDLRAVEPLIQALGDEDWRVRQKVAWALGYLGDPRAVMPLRRAYRNERQGVQEIIMEALDMIREQMARQ